MKKLNIGAVMALSILSASTALAQEGRRPGEPMLCPRPTSEQIGLKEVATPIAQDFSSIANSAMQAVVNDTGINKFFRHSFQWRDQRCCQIVSATLTVVTRANQAGTTMNASDARNDAIGIAGQNGASIAGNGGYLYSGPVPAGHVTTTTIVLNAAALARMNSTNRLSFYVQDDSAVTKAVLTIQRCCVGEEKRGE